MSSFLATLVIRAWLRPDIPNGRRSCAKPPSASSRVASVSAAMRSATRPGTATLLGTRAAGSTPASRSARMSAAGVTPATVEGPNASP